MHIHVRIFLNFMVQFPRDLYCPPWPNSHPTTNFPQVVPQHCWYNIRHFLNTINFHSYCSHGFHFTCSSYINWPMYTYNLQCDFWIISFKPNYYNHLDRYLTVNTFRAGSVMFLASLIQQDPIIRLTFCLIEFSLECSTPLVKES